MIVLIFTARLLEVYLKLYTGQEAVCDIASRYF
jgi:hypothetical protein